MEIRLKHANCVRGVHIRNEMKVGVLPAAVQNKLLGSFIDIVDATDDVQTISVRLFVFCHKTKKTHLNSSQNLKFQIYQTLGTFA